MTTTWYTHNDPTKTWLDALDGDLSNSVHFLGGDREANAALFIRAQHMGELVEAAKSFLGRYLDQFPGDKNPLPALSAKLRTAIATIDGEPTWCGSARDGECSAWHCPQNADGESHRSGRSCPLIWPER